MRLLLQVRRTVIDGEWKTFDFDQGEYPSPRNREELSARVVHFSEEHGVLDLLQDNAKKQFQIGKKLEFVPYHVCTGVNSHNYLVFAKNGEVEKSVKDLGHGMVS